jgi:hypothetical protein
MSLQSIVVIVRCLFVVGSSDLKMSATVQRENIQFCALPCRSPSEPLRTRMLEEEYGKLVMKKTHVYEWHKGFHAIVNGDLRFMRPSTSTN